MSPVALCILIKFSDTHVVLVFSCRTGGAGESGVHVVLRRAARLEGAPEFSVRDRRPPDADGRPAAYRTRKRHSRQPHTRLPKPSCVRDRYM